ncbi:MAG: hypothetical protein IJ361_04295 [Spirochaetaceae bacterium]|nr:hypothetical protein [Spirochaetaceae bacterium]
MSDVAFNDLLTQIDMLSYNERLRLLDRIVCSLYAPEKPVQKDSADFDLAFGLWKDREISVSEIRQKAWSRT